MAKTSRNLLLAAGLEMARLANEALARAGLPTATVVGEARRGVAVLEELCLLAHGPVETSRVVGALEAAFACEDVRVEGADIVRMRFEGGGPARLRYVPKAQVVEALVRETGSPRHVKWLEGLAKPQGGLAAVCERARDERAVYAALGVPFAPPELREGPTEVVPELVDSVAGVFHVHTTWSDGAGSLAEMVQAAQDAGFGYVGITEHSRAASYARGLDGAALARQAREVARARREIPGMRVLHGVEVDVLADGSLDLDDATLGALDFVIASVHTDLDMPEREMTARVLRAVRHPLVTILGHPTGRLLLGRAGSLFDVEAVATAAAGNDTYLEINANPQRLDLSDELVKRAATKGAKFAIDPDAHTARGMQDTGLGLSIARRAGLSAKQVLNARRAEEVITYLAARKKKGKKAVGIA